MAEIYDTLGERMKIMTPEGGSPLSPDQLRAVLLNRQFLDREEDGYADPFHGPMKPEEYED